MHTQAKPVTLDESELIRTAVTIREHRTGGAHNTHLAACFACNCTACHASRSIAVRPEEREQAKRVAYGILYGLTPYGLAQVQYQQAWAYAWHVRIRVHACCKPTRLHDRCCTPQPCLLVFWSKLECQPCQPCWCDSDAASCCPLLLHAASAPSGHGCTCMHRDAHILPTHVFGRASIH